MSVCVCGVHARIGGLFQHKNKLQNQIMKTRIRILAHRCSRSHLFESAFLIDFVPVVRSCGFAISTVFLLFNFFFVAKSCGNSFCILFSSCWKTRSCVAKLNVTISSLFSRLYCWLPYLRGYMQNCASLLLRKCGAIEAVNFLLHPFFFFLFLFLCGTLICLCVVFTVLFFFLIFIALFSATQHLLHETECNRVSDLGVYQNRQSPCIYINIQSWDEFDCCTEVQLYTQNELFYRMCTSIYVLS